MSLRSAVSGFGQVKTCRHATDEAPLHKREKTSGTQVTLQFVLQIQPVFFFQELRYVQYRPFKRLEVSLEVLFANTALFCCFFLLLLFFLLDLHKGANAEACSLQPALQSVQAWSRPA